METQSSVSVAKDTGGGGTTKSAIEVEKQQEMLLQAKYGNMRVKHGSALLQKRMAAKGAKYFDSGDYNMARAEMQKQSKSHLHPGDVTGKHMPTLEELPKGRKLPHPPLARHNPKAGVNWRNFMTSRQRNSRIILNNRYVKWTVAVLQTANLLPSHF